MKKTKTYVLNAIMLTATALIMKTVGVGFDIYLSNTIGAGGMGLYSLIMSVYAFGVTFATGGINIGTMRLCSQEKARNSEHGIKRVMLISIAFGVLIGTVGFLVLFFGADFIGCKLLCDTRSVSCLRMISVSLPMLSVMSAINGYFTAMRTVKKSALSQIIEMIVRIGITVWGLTVMRHKGIEYGCLSIVSGMCIGQGISLLYTVIEYVRQVRNFRCGETEKKPKTAKRFLNIVLPISFSAYVRSALVTVEHMLIPRGIRKRQSGEAGLVKYGMIQGMSLPIILYPNTIIYSFSGLLVPEIEELRERGNTRRISDVTARVIQLTLLYAICVCGIIVGNATELASSIYGNVEIAKYIRTLGIIIPIMYLDSATDSILKGLDQQMYSMKVNIADALVSVILVFILTPIIGEWGYIITIMATEVMNTALSLNRLVNVVEFRLEILKGVFKPLVCIISANIIVNGLFTIGGIMIMNKIAEVIVKIGITVAIYVFLVRCVGAVNREDRKFIKELVG